MSGPAAPGARLLDQMARKMRQQLMEISADSGNGWVSFELSRGLLVVLERRSDRWRLALARRAPGTPSVREAEICRQAFEAPEGTEVSPARPSKRNAQLMVIEMTWREVR